MMLELKELSMNQKEEIKQLQKDVEQYTYEVENVGFATWAEKEAVKKNDTCEVERNCETPRNIWIFLNWPKYIKNHVFFIDTTS